MGRPKGSKNGVSMFDRLDTILEHTQRNNECMEWKGHSNTDGYPNSKYKYKTILIHRHVACLVAGVDYNDPRLVRHLCDNRKCINPEHLILGNAKENALDRPTSLSEEEWEDIAGFHSLGINTQSISELYGIHRHTVYNGVSRRSHV